MLKNLYYDDNANLSFTILTVWITYWCFRDSFTSWEELQLFIKLAQNTVLMFYETLVRPGLLYRSKLWTLSGDDSKDDTIWGHSRCLLDHCDIRLYVLASVSLTRVFYTIGICVVFLYLNKYIYLNSYTKSK